MHWLGCEPQVLARVTLTCVDGLHVRADAKAHVAVQRADTSYLVRTPSHIVKQRAKTVDQPNPAG